MSIPTATYTVQSAVINAPLSQVFPLVRDLNRYAEWWSLLESSKAVGLDNDVEWRFKDGTVLIVKLEAFSALDHSVTYSIIQANPALSYTSQLSTIKAEAVTSGASEGSTFISFSGDFSGDADAGVVADAVSKRKEALADLAKKVAA